VIWEPDPDFWRDRRVCVTGGSGFLGSHVVAALCALGALVLVVTRTDTARTSICQSWWTTVQRARGDSAAKARRVLGWEPRNGFNEDLELTVEWYRSALGH
jgi:nucleoside-diphosphate-sugar epimerase